MTKAQQKRQAKYEEKTIKTRCPFCNSPLLKEELGVKRCANDKCDFNLKRKLKQETIL